MWHPIWIPAIYDEDGYNVAIETKWNTYVSALVTVTSSR
jgi:cell wall assembly regulator SMI1